jgi:hypothetical protein
MPHRCAHLRSNRLSLTVWNTHEQIIEACCQAWNALTQETGLIAPITTRPWAEVNE